MSLNHLIKANKMIIKKLVLFSALSLIFIGINAQSRNIINVPNLPGYQTLKCDFHMHSVFSDGTVWPTVRVHEAWEEGLDAISITDHIEYRPHSKDIEADHNRSYEIAAPLAKDMDIILVRGTEITRRMPPGHLNAIFIENANLIDQQDLDLAIEAAYKQDAIIMWNHPCWKSQQPDTVIWWDKHTELYNKNIMQGIEVYNGELCYEALDWANEKNLIMFGNSDVHGPIKVKEGHRDLTLVFTKERSAEGIKEALLARRTLVYFGNNLAGKPDLLKPFFFESIEIKEGEAKLELRKRKVIKISNNSDINYELELVQPGVGFDAPKKITLKAHQETSLVLTGNSEEIAKAENLKLNYKVTNLIVSSSDCLNIDFTFNN